MYRAYIYCISPPVDSDKPCNHVDPLCIASVCTQPFLYAHKTSELFPLARIK